MARFVRSMGLPTSTFCSRLGRCIIYTWVALNWQKNVCSCIFLRIFGVGHGGSCGQGRVLSPLKVEVLGEGNSVLSVMREHCSLPRLQIDFSKTKVWVQLNRIYMETGLRGMLREKHYQSLDMVFPFISAFVDNVSGYGEPYPMIGVHTMYSKI